MGKMPNVPRQLPRKRAPRAPRRRQRRQNPTTLVDKSTVLLAQPVVEVTNTVFQPSTIKTQLSVSGLAVSGAARLAAFLQLYDEFKFKRLHLRWEPALPSTTTGQVAVYYDPDPSAEAPTKFIDISGNEYMQVGHIARTRTLRVPMRALNARLNWFTRKDSGTSGTQGCVILVTSGGTVPHAIGQLALGSLWLDYEVHVRAPTSVAPTTYAATTVAPTMDQVIHDDLIDLQHYAKTACPMLGTISHGMVYDQPGVWGMRTMPTDTLGIQPPPEVCPTPPPRPTPRQAEMHEELVALRRELQELRDYILRPAAMDYESSASQDNLPL